MLLADVKRHGDRVKVTIFDAGQEPERILHVSGCVVGSESADEVMGRARASLALLGIEVRD